jgi:DNA helicase-2/ATP-dependent DNA helicase PcrA
MSFKPRPSQEKILSYRGGKMGISAVPGSGKTWTLSRLAADIIGRGEIGTEQEVLIVTLVNSAVENFSSRVSSFISEQGLLPQIGYRVRTLHGLAHDIVREKPALVGLEERFQIIDEREANLIRNDATQTWLRSNPDFFDEFLNPDLDDKKIDWIRNKHLPELINGIAYSFIRSAKDLRLMPDDLRRELDNQPASLPLADMGCDIYSHYQRALSYRGAVDFDDLIRLALNLLEIDPDFLERLRYRWPVILEDEAQDSSQLQEQILRLLTGEGGNWVRVGDPNQAIFETFTTANPWFLRNFIASEAEFHESLPESGRSQTSIILLGNRLVDWVMTEHPVPAVKDALLAPPYISPAPFGDPQPNPPDDPRAIIFLNEKYTPAEEIKVVIDSIETWLPDHKNQTVAILTPRNTRGSEVVDELKRRKIEFIEYLKNTSSTRASAGALGNVVAYLADPQSQKKLARCYEVWRRAWRADDMDEEGLYKLIPGLLRKCSQVESYLSPNMDNDWMAGIPNTEIFKQIPEESQILLLEELRSFRILVQRWQGSTVVTFDQMILSLAQDLFTDSTDLALAYKLALLLRQVADDHSDWRLPELSGELGVIARNERHFMGFSSEESGFDPGAHAGKVVVTTMHKAKGLEWDRVYLLSLNLYDFPSAQKYDSYISEKWFIRSGLNLEAEALAQLELSTKSGEFDWYQEGQATKESRLDYVRERLRLLYVGITRAKRDLFLSCNSGRTGKVEPSIPFIALKSWWEENHQ